MPDSMPNSNDPDLTQLVKQVIRISKEASKVILTHYRTGYDVSSKSDRSPVTSADLGANRVIISGLENLKPKWPIISEETAIPNYSIRSKWSHYWLIDPMDGTKSFINGDTEFTVNIALIEGSSPVLGVVHSPVEDRTYWGVKGFGAFCLDGKNGYSGKIEVNDFTGNHVRIIRPRFRGYDQTQAFENNLKAHSMECETFKSSSSIKFCRVAEGRVDVFPGFSQTAEWDTAAAHCVVECAGGIVQQLNGTPLIYNKRNLDNPRFIVSGGGDFEWRNFIPYDMLDEFI